MNGPKRHDFCTQWRLPFDAVIYSNPIPSTIGLIPKEKDFDVYIGTRVDVPAGSVLVPAGSVQYVVGPNVTVSPFGAPYLAQTVPFNAVGAPSQLVTVPPGGAPDVAPSTHMPAPSDPAWALYPPRAPPSAPSYAPTDEDPPSYEECQSHNFINVQ